MMRQWFEVFKISTKESPADLNTKALSRERREFLMKRIGLVSEVFGEDEEVPYQGRKKKLVKLLVNMIMASNLQGCGEETLAWTRSTSTGETGGIGCQTTRRHLKLAMFVILCMAIVMLRIFYKLTEEMEGIVFAAQGEVPYCEELDGDPFAENHEEEEPSPHETVVDGEAEDIMNAMELISTGSINGAVEAVGIRHRVLQAGGAHGSKDGDEARVPDEGGADDGKEPDDDDESFEVEETLAERYKRYLQSTMGECQRDALRFWDAR
jgi:hypothetical protein